MVTAGSCATRQHQKPPQFCCHVMLLDELDTLHTANNSPMWERFWYVHLVRRRHDVPISIRRYRPWSWKLGHGRNVEPCCLWEFSDAVRVCYGHRPVPVFTLFCDFRRSFRLTHSKNTPKCLKVTKTALQEQSWSPRGYILGFEVKSLVLSSRSKSFTAVLGLGAQILGLALEPFWNV